MAIITWSWIIECVSGRDGDMVHYRRGDTNCARAYVEQDDPNTDLQKSNRSLFSMAVRSWQGKAPEEKEVYAKRAVDLNMSGYNFYISEYMKAGASGKKHDTADKTDAESLVETQDFASLQNSQSIQHTDTAASGSLLLRFSFASASISPLNCRLPGPESRFSGGNRGLFPP